MREDAILSPSQVGQYLKNMMDRDRLLSRLLVRGARHLLEDLEGPAAGQAPAEAPEIRASERIHTAIERRP